ncbi:MAG: hypothetical protein R2940_05145 [Syntrophotaleaceae bacterium]
MYYLSLDVTPRYRNSGCQKEKKSLAHVLLKAKDCVKAARKAINYLERRQWEVQGFRQYPTLICSEEDNCKIAGAFTMTLDEGISFYLSEG